MQKGAQQDTVRILWPTVVILKTGDIIVLDHKSQSIKFNKNSALIRGTNIIPDCHKRRGWENLDLFSRL